MSKTLMIKYFYKGKQFSIKFSDGERNKNFLINKKIVIGSDPKLFWQVFDTNFVKRHDLVVKDKDDYYVNLLKTFTIEISKDNQALDLNELKTLGVLNNNRLLLKEDLSGKIILDANTYFTFEYRSFEKTLTKEDKDNLVIFNKKSLLQTTQKQNRFALIGVIILVGFLYLLIGKDYDPPEKLSEFAKQEIDFQSSMKVESEKDTSDEIDNNYDFVNPEDITDGEGDAEESERDAEAEQLAQQREERQTRRGQSTVSRGASTISRSEIANSSVGGNSENPGTGSILTVKATLSGLTGARSRDVGFSNIEASSGSNLSAITNRYKSDSGALGAAIVSNKGVSAAEIAGRNVGSLRRSGSANLADISASLGDGNANIEELTAIAGADADVARGRIDAIDTKPVDLSDSQKKAHFTEWFNRVLQPQLDAELRDFKNKKPIRGQLVLRFMFRDNQVRNVAIKALDSANDREFHKIIKDLLVGQICPNIGNYQVVREWTID